LGVHFTYRLPGLLQVGGNFSIAVRGLQRPWQNGQPIAQQIHGSAAFVFGLEQCQPKPCFGAGDGGDGDLLLFERRQHAHLQRSCSLRKACSLNSWGVYFGFHVWMVRIEERGVTTSLTQGATMQRLGVAHSRSRPAVSNDNPYSESLFRTLKYRPQLPLQPFADLFHARRWVTDLVHWYNNEHRHSAIRFVTLTQRHAGLDTSVLENRVAVYAQARQAKPTRWSGKARDWSRINEVHLNPNTPKNKEAKPDLKAA
jgi:hypothetical protein